MEVLTIQNYTDACRTTYANTAYGVQTMLLEMNSAGVPTSVVNGKMMVKNGGHLNNQWKPVAPYTIEYNVKLASGVVEERILSHDGTTASYYIDDILQPSNPQLPTDGILDDDAYIGNLDKIESINANFRVYTTGFDCPNMQPDYERLENYEFDCGLKGWGFDPKYPAILTYENAGEAHLRTDSNFGSLVPNNLPTESEEWVCEVKFKNQNGDGKISFRKPNNVWVSTPTLGDGVHRATYTGVISELHVGANGDANYEADYEYISLRKSSDPIPTAFMVDDAGLYLLDDDGKYITE